MRAFLARCRFVFFVGLLVQSQLQAADASGAPAGWTIWIGIRPGQTMLGLDRITYLNTNTRDGKSLSEVDHGRQRSLVIMGTTDQNGGALNLPDFATFEPLIDGTADDPANDLVYAVAKIGAATVHGWFFIGRTANATYPYFVTFNTATKYYTIRSASGSVLIVTQNVAFCDATYAHCTATTAFPPDPYDRLPARKSKVLAK